MSPLAYATLAAVGALLAAVAIARTGRRLTRALWALAVITITLSATLIVVTIETAT